MSKFKTLFKYELKKQFPTFNKDKKEFVGSFVSFLLTLLIVLVFAYFLTILSKNYILVRINKINLPYERAYELLNVFYLIALAVMSIITLENMRKTLTDKTDKQIMLKLPVKEQTIFLTKMLVLLLKTYMYSCAIIILINSIIYIALAPTALFWLSSVAAIIVFPFIVFLVAGIFIVPYIMFINFIKNKYGLIFIALTIVFVAGVFVYARFLAIVQSYLETGYIKFIFNEEFVLFMQSLTKWAYPSNCLSGLVLNKHLLKSVLVLVGCCLTSVVLVYFITKRLFHITLYKNESRKVLKPHTKFKKHSVCFALLKKEFISIVREPKHILSYLVVPTIMPILVYCCYTLFESLILNMLGINVPMALSLLLVIVFSVLTNTFCATNITREGVVFLKQKTFPIKAKQILDVKVLFCSFVSLASTITSCLVLIFATSLSIWDGLLCILVGGMFTISQILLATKLDLKNVKMSATSRKIAKINSMTILKVVSLGILISGLIGIITLVFSMISQTGVVLGEHIDICFEYLIPLVLSFAYMGFSIWFYLHKLQRALDNITL